MKSYIEANVDIDIYEVVSTFPGTELIAERLPLGKTLIHFELDDPRFRYLGFGDNVVSYEYDANIANVTPIEAQYYDFNFDLGIWASQESGGVTSRLNAFQALSNMFNGVLSYRTCFDQTDIQIRSFSGGMFTEEQINDLPVWRAADMTLIVCAFGRKTPTPIPAVQEVLVVPNYVDVENTEIDDS